MYVCERAERASLENFGIFTFLNCYIFQYFVGTSDTLSVQMTCLSAYTCTDKFPNVPTNFQMYRQKSEKALLGGGAIAPPAPPPPLATLMLVIYVRS